jgi:hypothetical protein
MLGFSSGLLRAATAESITQGSLRYTVEDLQGNASLTKEDGSTEALKEGSEIHSGDQIQLENDAQAVLMLNDETTVQLGAGVRLRVEQLEMNPQNGFFSKMKLLGGRILSQVQKLGISRSKFEVEAGGVVCGVRGTAFEVELHGGDVETRTHEGEVSAESDGKIESVKAGRACTFRRGLIRMRRRLDRTEMDRYAKWKELRLSVREKRHKRLRNLNLIRRPETRPLRRRR